MVFWYQCSAYGEGIKVKEEDKSPPNYPICKICGGKGYSVVQAPAESVAEQSQDRALNVNEFLQMVDEAE
jgi:hypothetical protein